MSSEFEYAVPVNEEEVEAIGAILSQAFSVDGRFWKGWSEIVGRENFRLMRTDGKISGGFALHQMGQWFGGRRVATGGIGAVGIPPEMRGRGIATRMMTEVLLEIRAAGIPLSTLYPASVALYRGVGYELAGVRYRHAVRTASIRARETSVPCRRAEVVGNDAFVTIAEQRGRLCPGQLDRNQTLWRFQTFSTEGPTYSYLFGPEQSPDGYLIFQHKPAESGYDVNVRDMVALSPATGRAVWTFLARHSAQCKEVIWAGGATDPLLWLLPELEMRTLHGEHWMVRIVDVAGALEDRGYPDGLTAELHLEVEDDMIPENAGRYILEIDDGQARVTRGGRGEVLVDIRGLASLYSGFLPASQLSALGRIEAPEDAIATTDRLFVGPQPSMTDGF